MILFLTAKCYFSNLKTVMGGIQQISSQQRGKLSKGTVRLGLE